MSFSTYAHPPPRFPNKRYTYTPPERPLPLLPILPPPTYARGPASIRRSTRLESSSSDTDHDSVLLPGWTLSKHTAPTAYPRTLPSTTSPTFSGRSDPYGPPTGQSKGERKEAIGRASSVAIRCGMEAGTGRRGEDDLRRMGDDRRDDREGEGEGEGEGVHYQSVDRWTLDPTPSSSSDTAIPNPGQTEPREKDKITLVCLHANGFHKEMFIPTLQHLLLNIDIGPRNPGSEPPEQRRKEEVIKVVVDEILLVDIYNHGESYLLNDGSVGRVFEWQDVARDIITLLQHCLTPPADEVHPRDVPEFLPFRPGTRSSSRGKRKIVGIGHSIGGNALVQASHAQPDLFHQLILIDPMTRPLESLEPGEGDSPASNLVKTCIGRRDTWPDLKSAESDLLRSPFFRRWDKGVFRSFVQHGLGKVSKFPTYTRAGGEDEGTVGLMTPRWAEAAVFAGGKGMVVGYDKLAGLRRDMKVTFIMAEDASSTGGQERTHDIVWRPPRAENVIVKGAGHLVMQEKPLEVAKAIHASLNGRIIECDEKVFADKARL